VGLVAQGRETGRQPDSPAAVASGVATVLLAEIPREENGTKGATGRAFTSFHPSGTDSGPCASNLATSLPAPIPKIKNHNPSSFILPDLV